MEKNESCEVCGEQQKPLAWSLPASSTLQSVVNELKEKLDCFSEDSNNQGFVSLWAGSKLLYAEVDFDCSLESHRRSPNRSTEPRFPISLEAAPIFLLPSSKLASHRITPIRSSPSLFSIPLFPNKHSPHHSFSSFFVLFSQRIQHQLHIALLQHRNHHSTPHFSTPLPLSSQHRQLLHLLHALQHMHQNLPLTPLSRLSQASPPSDTSHSALRRPARP